MGGAVFSGGDLQYAGAPADAAPSASDGAAAAPPPADARDAEPAPLPAGMEMAPSLGAAGEEAADEAAASAEPMQTEDGGGGGGGGGGDDEEVLTAQELAALLRTERVQRAMGEIVADPEAVVRYQLDEVLMGVLYTLAASGKASSAEAAQDDGEDCD